MFSLVRNDPNRPKRPSFDDVGFGQFFIDNGGYFCQKIDICTYVQIAKSNNKPYGDIVECDSDEKITKILPVTEYVDFDKN